MAKTSKIDRPCWICTGQGFTLCAVHDAEARDRAARYNTDLDTAIVQLRQDVIAETEFE
jgi:hypothetical protein